MLLLIKASSIQSFHEIWCKVKKIFSSFKFCFACLNFCESWREITADLWQQPSFEQSSDKVNVSEVSLVDIWRLHLTDDASFMRLDLWGRGMAIRWERYVFEVLQREFEKSLKFEEGCTGFLKELTSPEEKGAPKHTMRTEHLVLHTQRKDSDSISLISDCHEQRCYHL